MTDEIIFYLQGAGIPEAISATTGIGEAGLRLILSLLLGYAFAVFYRFFLPSNATGTILAPIFLFHWLNDSHAFVFYLSNKSLD